MKATKLFSVLIIALLTASIGASIANAGIEYSALETEEDLNENAKEIIDDTEQQNIKVKDLPKRSVELDHSLYGENRLELDIAYCHDVNLHDMTLDRPALSHHLFENCLECVSQRELMPAPAEKIRLSKYTSYDPTNINDPHFAHQASLEGRAGEFPHHYKIQKEKEFTPAEPPKDLDLSKYTSHNPIHIDGNANFSSQAQYEGWAGDGTEGSPYIIENYYIDASTADGIYIKNTNVYFIIRDSVIRNGNYNCGIYFYSVQNGTIYNVILYNNYHSIYLYDSSNNQITNCDIYNNYNGIYLDYASNNKITNCNVYDNSYYGIYLYYASNYSITNCNVYNNSYGIYLDYYSNNNSITNCNVYNSSYYGIYLYYSSNSNITNCNVYNNSYGIYLDYASNNTIITNCIVYYNFIGVLPYYSSNNNLTNCIVYYNFVGIDLYYASNNNSITKCDVYNNLVGIYLYYLSNNNSITNCYVYNNPWYGIYLFYSSNNDITNCNVYNNSYGILLYYASNYNSITDCNIYENYVGVYLVYSSNNQITNCNVYNNPYYGIWLYYDSSNNDVTNCNVYNNSDHGILLTYSSNNNITNNIFTNNGIFIWGNLDDCAQTIENNIVNDKPLYYFLDENAITLDNIEVGQLILVNCANFKIKNLGISYTDVGIELLYSSENSVTNCNVYNSSYGVVLLYASDNNLTNSNVYNNYYYGIWMSYSSDNQITNCAVYNNSEDGIRLYYYCSNNQITNCNVYNNSLGIWLEFSSNNRITNNIFTNNGIFIWGDLYDCAQTIENNTVNGKPLYYFLNENRKTLDSIEVGQLILVNCANFKIKNLDVSYTDVGIELLYSSKNSITNCSVYNNYYGIVLLQSSGNKITNCNVYNNHDYYGICLHYSSNSNSITNCDVYNNSHYGIYLYYASNNNITNCYVYNSSEEGIYLDYYSKNNNITNCNVYNNSFGIYLYYASNGNKITNCTVYNNSFGILLIYSSNNRITNCTAYNNYVGVYLYYLSNNNIITNCTVYNNSWYGLYGILLVYSLNNQITNCNVYNNSYDGILLYYKSNNNIITNCNVYNNSEVGIDLYYLSDNNIIANCNVYSNSYGIYLWYSSNNQIYYCNIYNNADYGVYNWNTEYGYVVSATYNWWNAENGPGGVGSGRGDKVSANVIYDPWLLQPLDFTPPIIIQTTPSNNAVDIPVDTTIVIIFSEPMNNLTIPGNITIEPDTQISEYNWSDDNTILALRFDYSLSSSTKYTVTINTNVQDASYYIQASDDSSHATGGNHLQLPYQFSFRTKDVTKPGITNIKSNPSPQEVHSYVNITCTVTDDVAVSLVRVIITGPLGFIPINETMIRIAGTDSYHYNTTYHTIGTYYYYVWASDVSGNSDSSITDSFVVRDTTLPQISNIKAAPEIQEVYGYVNISCTVIDNVAVNIVKINITGPAGFTSANATMNITGTNNYYYNASHPILGTYYYYIWANDTSNNRNESEIHQFTIQDTTRPQILNVQAVPLTQTQGGWVNITCAVTDNVGVSIVTLNIFGTMGFTPINTTMIIIDTHNYYYNTIYLIAGTYYYYVWAEDTSGNGNKSAEHYFTVTIVATEIIDNKAVNVIGAGNGTVNVESATLPQPSPENLRNIICINVTITGTLDYVNITIKYSESDIAGLNEATLRMYYWDETEGKWLLCNNTGVDTVSNIVWANVTHLTIFAPLAEKVEKAEAPMINWLFYTGLSVIIVVILVSVGIGIKRRKRTA